MKKIIEKIKQILRKDKKSELIKGKKSSVYKLSVLKEPYSSTLEKIDKKTKYKLGLTEKLAIIVEMILIIYVILAVMGFLPLF